MQWKIRKQTVLQLIVLILMFYIHGSYALIALFGDNRYIIVTALAIIIILMHSINYLKNIFIFAVVTLFFTVFVRMATGGVGVRDWLIHLSMLSITYAAFVCDRNNCAKNWVKIVTFYSTISILFFVLSQISPELTKSILGEPRIGITSVTEWSTTSYMVWGKWLYVYSQYHAGRNLGVFTEPGLFQIVVNSALFVVLFQGKMLGNIEKYRRPIVFILIATVITCQSTSGYFALAVMMIFYFVKYKNDELLSKKSIVILITAFVTYLIYDYSKNGTDSMIYTAIIRKLFTDSGFSLSSDTGSYRITTIFECLYSAIRHPLGVGYDAINNSLQASGGVGAAVMTYLAGMGIIPFAFIMYWIFKPLHGISANLPMCLLVVFLYFNSALAQSAVFYPGLIIIPILLNYDNTIGGEIQDDSRDHF